MDAKELRASKVSEMIVAAPESAKSTMASAFNGHASPRKAIKAMCLACLGYERSAITNCTGWSCPLWAYRPFQQKEAK
jgi:hypothetical protein